MNKRKLYSDVEISKSLINGDVDAYNMLFKRYYSFLCNYIVKLSKNRDLAEDLAQETFMKVWNRRHKIDENASIKGYLLKICHNEFLQHIKKEKKERALLYELRSEVIYEIYAEKEAINYKRIDKLRDIINELPPKCKEAFVSSKYENLKYTEIAEKMGISIKTVEIHISKAYSELRKKMQTMINLF